MQAAVAAPQAAGNGNGGLGESKVPQASPLSVLDSLALQSPSPCSESSPFGTTPRVTPVTSLQRGRSSTPPRETRGQSLEREFDAHAGPVCDGHLPATPVHGRTRGRTPPMTRYQASRKNSLNDNKVLVATNLKRTESLVEPSLFQFTGHFEFLSLLGSSKHSEVYLVRHKHTNELFAVKRCRNKFQTRADRERCMHEIQAVAALPAHPHIVGHFRAWQQEGRMYIQMDVAQGGSLAGLLQQSRSSGTPLPEELLWQVAGEVAAGLDFLSTHGVLHLDIKPSNLYRNLEGRFMIGDFGLAVLRKEWDWEEGDGDYVAPELLLGGAEPTAAADVYSLGASLYECATGHTLPRSGPEREGSAVMLPHRSTALQWLVQQMLCPNPARRPTAAQVVQQVTALHGPRPPPLAATLPNSSLTAPAPPPAAEQQEVTSPLRPLRARDYDVAAPVQPRSPFERDGDPGSSPFANFSLAAGRTLAAGSPASPAWACSRPMAVPVTQAGAAAGGGGSPSQSDAVGSSQRAAGPARAPSLLSLMSFGSYSSEAMSDACGFSSSCGEAVGGLVAQLSFGRALEGSGGGGTGGLGGLRSGECGDGELPPAQPSATPTALGKSRRGGSQRRLMLPPRAPSFSFRPSVEGERPLLPAGCDTGERMARCMSGMSLIDAESADEGGASGSDVEPMAPTCLFGSLGHGGSLRRFPSFAMSEVGT